jgi:uncharacterized membrane protein
MMFEHTESWVMTAITWLRLMIESLGAIVIAVGILVSIVALIRLLIRRAQHETLALHQGFVDVRLGFARYLALGLEFQLAADILSTAVAPSWDQIGKLAAIAVIRTGLNFFLMREMQESHTIAAKQDQHLEQSNQQKSSQQDNPH